MNRMPLTLQIFAGVMLVLGVALGVGFYPALVLEGRHLAREREEAMVRPATAVAFQVGRVSGTEVDEGEFQASVEGLISVPSVRRQLVSLKIQGEDPVQDLEWLNPDLAKNLTQARRCLDLSALSESKGRYNLPCKALATALQLLSEPPNTGRGGGIWNESAADRLCLKDFFLP